MNIIIPAIKQAILFLPISLAIFFSYRILRITDLTPEGSFVLGAALFARCTLFGISPLLGTIVGVLGGGLVGVGVALMQRRGVISPLVASILALFMLYSINFQIMGVPNINLLDKVTMLSPLRHTPWLWVIVGALVLVTMVLLGWYLLTREGLKMRAFGSNQQAFAHLGYSVERYRALGLALSNALAAFGGVLASQVDCFVDIQMGFGVALTGIGSVVMGQHLISYIWPQSRFQVVQEFVGVLLGVLVYFISLQFLMASNIVHPINLKLLLGIMLTFFLRSAHTMRGSVS